MTLLLLQNVMARVHFPWKCLSKFWPVFFFFLLLLSFFDEFEGFVRYLIHFQTSIIQDAGPHHRPFCCQSMPFLYFLSSLCSPWGSADQCPVSQLFLLFSYGICPIDWGCRIHRLHLCRGIRPLPQRVSWIWH